MSSWQVGAVKISRVVEIVVPFPEGTIFPEATLKTLKPTPWLIPQFVTEGGAIPLSVHALLVETLGKKIIVDTGIGNDKPRHLLTTLGMQPLSTPFLQNLANAGASRETIDLVINTHLHIDHVGWNTMLVDGKFVPTFPKARHLIGSYELDHWRREGDEEQQVIMADSVQPILDAGLADLVEPNDRVSPEICLMPSPGHTPGHFSLLIDSEGQRAVIAGDIAHHPVQMAHPEWHTGFDSDVQLAIDTRRRLFSEWADQPILVFGGHYGPGYIKRDGAVFRFKTA